MVRGATLIHGHAVRLQDTTISPTSDVCPTLRNTLRYTHFLRTLRGPFAMQCSNPILILAGSLCGLTRRYLRFNSLQ
jgi:hypothetical protein